jgi:DNA-binding transcriptional LysR family regulator
MELRHIRYFVAAAEEQNVRRAAERLRIAQPAVTRQIADLEDEIGCQLFDRLPRGIRLNAAGLQFLGDARKLLAQVDLASANALRASRGEFGSLRVGFIEPASWEGAFPVTIQRYRSRHPHVTLQMLPMYSRDQLKALEIDELDAGFCYLFETLPSSCSSVLLRQDSVLLAVPRRYGWRQRKSLKLRDLTDEPIVWLSRSRAPLYVDALLQSMIECGYSPNIVEEAVDESTMLSLVAAGMGIGFVNSANKGRQPASVDFVPVHDLNFRLPLHLAWNRHNTSATLYALIGLAKQASTKD